MNHNKSLQLTKIPVTNFGAQNVAPGIFATKLSVMLPVEIFNKEYHETEHCPYFIGNQAGGRVFLFLNTDDFWRDFERMKSMGINFVREPAEQDYGTVAVFEDLYGNLWDLLQLNSDHPIAKR